MLVRALGPLEVRADGGWGTVGASKWRALLAVLVLCRRRVAAVDLLIDELWPETPPAGARKLVSLYVLRLRRLLGDPDGRVLVTQAPGYRLMLADADLDVPEFEWLVASGRATLMAGDVGQARDLLVRALALCHGEPLADVPHGPLVTAEAARLEELRMTAMELWVEACLCCGHQAEVVPELLSLTSAHPLRERLWQQLMRALELDGRSAEALRAYARLREKLAAELGADPGPELQRLHQRLLTARLPTVSAGDLLLSASGQLRPSG